MRTETDKTNSKVYYEYLENDPKGKTHDKIK